MRKSIIISIVLFIVISFSFNTNSSATTTLVHGNEMSIGEISDSIEIPTGFTKTNTEFNGETIEAIYNEESEIYMVYLTSNIDDRLNGFYTYSIEEGFNTGVSLGINARNLIISSPNSDITIPTGYSRTILVIENIPVIAFKQDEDDGTGNVLVFGSIDGVNYSWYLFNPDDLTCNKIIVDDTLDAKIEELEKTNEILEDKYSSLSKKYTNNISKGKLLYIIEFVISVICIFLMINAMVKRYHKKLDYEDRILDLKINKGIETLPASNKELKKRDKLQEKAKERRKKYFGDDFYDKGNIYPESALNKKRNLNYNRNENPLRKNKVEPRQRRIDSSDSVISEDGKRRIERKLNEQGHKPTKRVSENKSFNRMPPRNNIDIANLEKNLEAFSNDKIRDIKNKSISTTGITGSMDFGDDLDITTFSLDE